MKKIPLDLWLVLIASLLCLKITDRPVSGLNVAKGQHPPKVSSNVTPPENPWVYRLDE